MLAEENESWCVYEFSEAQIKKVICELYVAPCDVRTVVLSKLSTGDNLGPEALDASAHALQLQTMTSTMGKYININN